MSTVTESDIKELKELMKGLDQKVEQIKSDLIEVKAEVKINNAKIEALDKRMSDGLNNLDKRITDGLNNQEKRIANQEFIYRTVFISIIAFIATSFITVAVRFLWDNPIAK